MVSEALVFMCKKAESLGFVRLLEIGENQVRVKHMQLADGTLLFVSRDT